MLDWKGDEPEIFSYTTEIAAQHEVIDVDKVLKSMRCLENELD